MRKLLLYACILSLPLAFVACGDDEPQIDEPQSEQQTPDPEPEPDPEPDPEPEPSKYYTPTEDELIGRWRCTWRKTVSYNRYELSESFRKEITIDDDFSSYNPYRGAYFLDNPAFLPESVFFWDISWQKYDEACSALDSKGNWNYDMFYIENGGLTSKGYYWSWNPDYSVVAFKQVSGTHKVAHRIKISNFDGQTFEAARTYDEDIYGWKSKLYFYSEYFYKYERVERPTE